MFQGDPNKLLSPTEVSLLGMIDRKGPVSLNSLARSCFCSTDTLQPYINNLVSGDFLIEEHLAGAENQFRLK